MITKILLKSNILQLKIYLVLLMLVFHFFNFCMYFFIKRLNHFFYNPSEMYKTFHGGAKLRKIDSISNSLSKTFNCVTDVEWKSITNVEWKSIKLNSCYQHFVMLNGESNMLRYTLIKNVVFHSLTIWMINNHMGRSYKSSFLVDKSMIWI